MRSKRSWGQTVSICKMFFSENIYFPAKKKQNNLTNPTKATQKLSKTAESRCASLIETYPYRHHTGIAANGASTKHWIRFQVLACECSSWKKTLTSIFCGKSHILFIDFQKQKWVNHLRGCVRFHRHCSLHIIAVIYGILSSTKLKSVHSTSKYLNSN